MTTKLASELKVGDRFHYYAWKYTAYAIGKTDLEGTFLVIRVEGGEHVTLYHDRVVDMIEDKD